MDYQVKAVLEYGVNDAAINEDDKMIFGSANGVQWARFSDVIYHEYFHLVHRKLIGSAVYNYLTEGLADYFACTINDDPNYGENTTSSNNRQLLNTIQYTPGANQYLNGQALSGTCWDIREELGSTIADQLVFKALQLNPNPSSIAVFANNVKKIDFQYYNSNHQNTIVEAFNNHGIIVQVPSAPQNVVEQQHNQGDVHPTIHWDANSGSNLSGYNVYRNNNLIASTTSTLYTDYSVYYEGQDMHQISYKITAFDTYNYESTYSNTVEIEGQHDQQQKINAKYNTETKIFKYTLESNYPNPFNPTTQLSYQIAQDGFVNLSIYNSLGQKVAILVNQYQLIGKYSVQFNAYNLPSGVYIYKLESREFRSTKKMLLTK